MRGRSEVRSRFGIDIVRVHRHKAVHRIQIVLGRLAGSAASSSLDNTAATGTPFAGGPATLPATNQVFLHQNGSLPGGALNLYHNATDSAAWAKSFGSGNVVYLAYDWFSGSQASWDAVLGRAVTDTATDIPSNVPEPGALGLTAAALALARLRSRPVRR